MRVFFKLFISVLFLVIGVIRVNAQLIASPDEYLNNRISRCYKSTVLVILEDDDKSYYNDLITHSFNSYWKIGKFKFIKKAEVKAYSNNDKYSFFSFGHFADDARVFSQPYYGFSLSLVEPLTVNVISYSYGKDSLPVINLTYKLVSVVQMMQDYISYHHKRINKLDKKLPGYIVDYYNSRKKELYKKKIYINQDDINKYYDKESEQYLLTVEGVTKNFRVKPEVVSADIIAKAIMEQDEKVVFVDGYGKFTNLVTAKDGKVVSCGKGYIPNNKKMVIKSIIFGTTLAVAIILAATR